MSQHRFIPTSPPFLFTALLKTQKKNRTVHAFHPIRSSGPGSFERTKTKSTGGAPGGAPLPCDSRGSDPPCDSPPPPLPAPRPAVRPPWRLRSGGVTARPPQGQGDWVGGLARAEGGGVGIPNGLGGVALSSLHCQGLKERRHLKAISALVLGDK